MGSLENTNIVDWVPLKLISSTIAPINGFR